MFVVLIRLAALLLISGVICSFTVPDPIVITLEHARNPRERRRGLMHRKALPRNHGMLFTYPNPQLVTIWAYNCFIDLDVAFLSEGGVISQIAHLKAYPEASDPQFFLKHSITSRLPCKRVLETASGFFAHHNVQEGDLLFCGSDGSMILHPHEFLKSISPNALPVEVSVSPPKPVALSIAPGEERVKGGLLIDFFDRHGFLLHREQFSCPSKQRQTVCCFQPAASIKISSLEELF